MAALVKVVTADDGNALAFHNEETQQLFIDVHGKDNAPYVWKDEHNTFLKTKANRSDTAGRIVVSPDPDDPVARAGIEVGKVVGDIKRGAERARDWSGDTIGNIASRVGSAVVNPPQVGRTAPTQAEINAQRIIDQERAAELDRQRTAAAAGSAEWYPTTSAKSVTDQPVSTDEMATSWGPPPPRDFETPSMQNLASLPNNNSSSIINITCTTT